MKTPARPDPRGPAPPPTRSATAVAAEPPALRSQSIAVARLVPLDPGLYAVSLRPETRWQEPIAGFPVPAVHVSTPPGHHGLEITDSSGRPGAWLGGHRKVLFVKAPRGSMALLTAYVARDSGEKPLDIEVRRLDGDAAGAASPSRPGSAALPLVASLSVRAPAPPSSAAEAVRFELVAHVRGRGDLRFDGAGWAGRLGRGHWIEAFAIIARDPAIAAAIEYKGLIADGTETPWIGNGSPCGTRGRTMPLLGFAIRQKALPGGAQFDCGYSAYFLSGTTAGPFRNGAPCRSPQANDPLEGMQVHIAARPARAAPALPP